MDSPSRDEDLSWLIAAAIMIFVSIASGVSRLLGSDPFTDVFDLFIVYLPTAVLVGGVLHSRSRRLPGDTGQRLATG